MVPAFPFPIEGGPTFTGSALNEKILGTENGSDTLVGDEGRDILQGYGGNDAYVFRAGDGTDFVIDTGGTDTSRLAGNDAKFERIFDAGGNYTNDLRITYGRCDTITVLNQFNGGPTIERVTFEGVAHKISRRTPSSRAETAMTPRRVTSVTIGSKAASATIHSQVVSVMTF